MNTATTIKSGLSRLRQSLHGSPLSMKDTLRLMMLVGLKYNKCSLAFQQWALRTGITRARLRAFIAFALADDSTTYINYDGDTLSLNIPRTVGNYDTVWFISQDFERYVGSQAVRFECIGESKILLPADEYLREYWKLKVSDFVLNNLDRAEVEVDHD